MIAVAVDVGSRPVLGSDSHLVCAVEIGRSAVADSLDRKPGPLAEIDRLGEPSVGLDHRVLRRISHEPFEFEPRSAIDRLRQRGGFRRGCDPAALRSRVALDQHRQLKAGAGRGGGQAFDHFTRVRDNLDVGATGESNKAIELGLTDDVIGQQDVGDPRVRHDLRLAKLLTVDTLRAELDLQMGELGDLVGLDVRAKAQSVTIKIGLTPPEIVLHHVEIDHRARRIQVLGKHLGFSFVRAHRTLQRDWSRPDKGNMPRIRPPSIRLRQPSDAIASSRFRNCTTSGVNAWHTSRDCLVAGLDQLGQFAGVSGPLRRDDADLGQVAAQPVEQLRALRDQHLPRLVMHQRRLIF